MIRQAEWLVVGALSVLLLWAPLPFGSATSWSAALLEVAVLLLFAGALLSREAPIVLHRLALPAGALVGIALFGWLQSLPWSRPLAELVSPGHIRLFDAARDILAGHETGESSLALSLAAGESRRTALSFAAAAAALIAAGIIGRERKSRRALALALIAAALFQVLYGAHRWFARSREIWGRAVPGTNERLRGTFVNPNHLAFFLGLALPVVFAWGWWSFRRAREESRPERKLLWSAPPVIAWLLLFAGLAFTGSRTGLVAALVAVVTQGALLAAGERRRRLFVAGIGIAGLGVGLVALIGREEGFGRLLGFGGGSGWAARVEAWRASIDLISRFPMFGTGLGSFREAFPLVQPAELAGTWRHAHNDPLELLVTVGWVGLALGVVGLVGLLRSLVAGFREGRRSEDRAAALAALGALVAAGIHESVDFSLTLPANAFALAVLLGAAAAVRRSGEPHRTGYDGAAIDRGHLDQMKPGGDRKRRQQGRALSGDEGADETAIHANLDDRAPARYLVDLDREARSGAGGDDLSSLHPLTRTTRPSARPRSPLRRDPPPTAA